jgi:hypothetical protein
MLSDQLSDYEVDVSYIQPHIRTELTLSSDLDNSPTVLRVEGVAARHLGWLTTQTAGQPWCG